LRPEELLKQYHEKRTALDANIDAQLREIENMLGITID
jgi:type I restriction enzyme M protein